MCDPQTSGGLLLAIDPSGVEQAEQCVRNLGHEFYRIGYMAECDGDKYLKVI
jgi:selenophosphate synthase